MPRGQSNVEGVGRGYVRCAGDPLQVALRVVEAKYGPYRTWPRDDRRLPAERLWSAEMLRLARAAGRGPLPSLRDSPSERPPIIDRVTRPRPRATDAPRHNQPALSSN
jgi:hypothetical protein